MKEKVASLETQLALLRNDIESIKHRQPELPAWLRNSAVIMLMAMLGQIMTSVWWASKITTSVDNIKHEVSINSEFRTNWPKYHQEIAVGLAKIEAHQKSTDEKLKDIKSKLKFVGKNGKEN